MTLRRNEHVTRKPNLLVATFPEGHTGPDAFLRALLANRTFRERFDVTVWHVPDLYRGALGKWRLCRDARRRLRASGADVVYLNLDLSLAFWLCIAFHLAGARRVATRSLNAVFDAPATRLGRLVYRYGISRLVNARIAISEEAAHAMYTGALDDVILIPCLIDFDALHRDSAIVPIRSRQPGDRFVFGCVGRLMAQKNQTLIVRALAQLHRQGVDAELLLVGEGDDRAALESLAATEGIADRLTLMGTTENIGAIYRNRIDALLVPSLYEGQGRIVAEAQSFGLPLALSRHIPAMAVLDDAGIIANLPLEPDAWCEAMRRLMHMPRGAAWPLHELNRHRLSLAYGVALFCQALLPPPSLANGE